jgi:hypothetical protein
MPRRALSSVERHGGRKTANSRRVRVRVRDAAKTCPKLSGITHNYGCGLTVGSTIWRTRVRVRVRCLEGMTLAVEV